MSELHLQFADRQEDLDREQRWCVRDQGPLCERSRCGFHLAGVMKEHDLQTVRPRWVCGTQEEEEVEQGTYDLEKSPSSLEVDAKDPEQECGQRRLSTMLDPILPSQSEVQQHCLTHAVQKLVPALRAGQRKGDGPQEQERHRRGESAGVPGVQKLTILVVVERHSKMKKEVVVPSKGSTGRYAVRMVLDLIEECRDEVLGG